MFDPLIRLFIAFVHPPFLFNSPFVVGKRKIKSQRWSPLVLSLNHLITVLNVFCLTFILLGLHAYSFHVFLCQLVHKVFYELDGLNFEPRSVVYYNPFSIDHNLRDQLNYIKYFPWNSLHNCCNCKRFIDSFCNSRSFATFPSISGFVMWTIHLLLFNCAGHSNHCHDKPILIFFDILRLLLFFKKNVFVVYEVKSASLDSDEITFLHIPDL